jgi:DNA-directed RNA polymerase beta' subunit
MKVEVRSDDNSFILKPETEFEESTYDKIKKFFSGKKEGPAKIKKGGWTQILFDYVVDKASEGEEDNIREQMEEAGIKGFGDILKPKKVLETAGITNESVVINKRELKKQLEKIILKLGRPALIEEYIEGDEYELLHHMINMELCCRRS